MVCDLCLLKVKVTKRRFQYKRLCEGQRVAAKGRTDPVRTGYKDRQTTS